MLRSILLASQSRYRRQLLDRLRLPYRAVAHRIEERLNPALAVHEQVEDLAVRKAESVRDVDPEALVIGSDQGLVVGGRLLGKPGSVKEAIAQLERMSGGTHALVTAVALLDAASGELVRARDVHRMTVRQLSRPAIERYVALDKPLDCAGSFRIEALGIALFAGIEGEDPTAIMGLPLMRVVDLLAHFGISPLA